MRRLSPLLVTSLAVLSCSPPPFNLELSLGARTARTLTTEGTVGPIDGKSVGSEISDALFFPETGTSSGLDLLNGFLLFTDSFGVRDLVFISWNQGKKMYMPSGPGIPFGSATADPYPGFQIMNLKGAPHSVGGFTFSSQDASNNRFDWAQADPAASQFPVSINIATNLGLRVTSALGAPTGNVIGVSRYSAMDPSTETTYWLFKTLSGDSFLEVSVVTDAVSVLTPAPLSGRPSTPSSLGAQAPTGLTRALYYYDAEPSRDRSYLSWYDPATGHWRCWWWSGAAPQAQELTGVNHRVDAVLTTGELLSTEGDAARVYSPDGALRATFPLSGLHFIEERYVNETARLLFSQCLFYDDSAWVNIYSIPTKDLDTIAAW